MSEAVALRAHMELTWERLLLVSVGAAGIVLRVLTYRSTLGVEDSDEAFIGLMVRHAEHGHLTGFMWGHAYGGILEILLAVPVFWIFGPSILALRTIPIVLDLAAVYLVWRAGRRTIGEPAARYAAALAWIWPSWTIFEHMHEWGFYSSDALFSVLLLLLALRAKEEPSALRVGLFGLVAGVAFYETFQIAPVAITVGSWLAWRQRRVLRHAWLAVVLALVGALPVLLWNLRHHWATLHLEAGADFSYRTRLRLFISPVIPEDLGLKFSGSMDWILPTAVGAVLYVAVLALFAYGAYRSRRRDLMVVYVTIAVFPLLATLSPKVNALTDPRYAMVLAPYLALVVGQAASTNARAAVILGLALVVAAVGLRGFDRYTISHRNFYGPSPPRSLSPVVAELGRLGIDRVFTNYWLAYRLDFDTNERIVAVESRFEKLVEHNGDVVPTRDPVVTWRPYEDAVRAGPHAFVFFDHFLPEPDVLRTLARHGYTRHSVDGFVVYAPPRSVSRR
jgi:hypothetical protein